MMRQTLTVAGNELRLLLRDIHGLLLLFVMPLLFILIMSLAMRDQFRSHQSASAIRVWASDDDHSQHSAALLQALGAESRFALQAPPTQQIDAALLQDEAALWLRIPAGYGAAIDALDTAAPPLQLRIAPSTSAAVLALFSGSLQKADGLLRLQQLLDGVGVSDRAEALLGTPPQVEHVYRSAVETAGEAPSSVQQSVPAWLVFSMFFIVVPLSNTLINERRLGTLSRLRVMNLSPLALFAGKALPYLAIHQLQTLAMLAVGIYLVPLLGGDALQLGPSPAALALVALGVSLAAIGYALLIASLARTTEQATTLGGAGNIILAAIGGIMVPKFVMPPAMQALTELSPMAWGLDAFLDVLLRQGGVQSVLPTVGQLAVAGLIATALAVTLHQRRR